MPGPYRLRISRSRADWRRESSTVRPPRNVTVSAPDTARSTWSIGGMSPQAPATASAVYSTEYETHVAIGAGAAGAAPPGTDHVEAGARSRAAGRRRVYEEDPGIHHGAVFQLATDRLPPGLEDRAHAQGRARRRFRGAQHPALCRGCLQVHADAGEGIAAGQSVQHRAYRGRPRDDRGRGCEQIG